MSDLIRGNGYIYDIGDNKRWEGQMKEYICELCKKPIKKSDIRMTFNIRIDDRKTEEADMHAHCYYEFMEFARENLIEDEKN